MSLDQAVERAEELLTTAVRRQLESEVPLGSLLSGGIDSSLVSAAAQAALAGGLRTFNVKFSDKEYDETWAAVAVAKNIGSHHETLDMDAARNLGPRNGSPSARGSALCRYFAFCSQCNLPPDAAACDCRSVRRWRR